MSDKAFDPRSPDHIEPAKLRISNMDICGDEDVINDILNSKFEEECKEHRKIDEDINDEQRSL